ncbi:MAG: hydroxyisourate hydrolase, partial [Pseudomonadota bacterium]
MADGFLTTHVLDTARGVPASGLRILLNRISVAGIEELAEMVTNADGRTDGAILPQDKFQTGDYELLFFAGDYLRHLSHPEADRHHVQKGRATGNLACVTQ